MEFHLNRRSLITNEKNWKIDEKKNFKRNYLCKIWIMSGSKENVRDLLGKAISRTEPTIVNFGALRDLLHVLEHRIVEDGPDITSDENVVSVNEFDQESTEPDTGKGTDYITKNCFLKSLILDEIITIFIIFYYYYDILLEDRISIEKKRRAKEVKATKPASEVKSTGQVRKQDKSAVFSPKLKKSEDKNDKKKKSTAQKNIVDEKIKTDTDEMQSIGDERKVTDVEDEIKSYVSEIANESSVDNTVREESEIEKKDDELTYNESGKRSLYLDDADEYLIDDMDEERVIVDPIEIGSSAQSLKETGKSEERDEKSSIGTASTQSKPQKKSKKDDSAVAPSKVSATKVKKTPKDDSKPKTDDPKTVEPKDEKSIQKRPKETKRTTISSDDKSTIPTEIKPTTSSTGVSLKSATHLRRSSRIKKLTSSAEKLDQQNDAGTKVRSLSPVKSQQPDTVAKKTKPKVSALSHKCDKMTQTCPLGQKTNQKKCECNGLRNSNDCICTPKTCLRFCFCAKSYEKDSDGESHHAKCKCNENK